ncbi:hypothetical protein [Nonomuraea sp. NPDC049400]|uniref:hypothetical protein n=1 Tax=Nonomuraea sp. NPDC049400 TaxID=3364352 RepID=UPI00379B0E71
MTLIPLAVSSASADPVGPIPERPRYVYSIKVTSVHNGAVLYNKQLASCSAGVGGTCSISKSFSVQRTIQLSLGVTRGFVAGQIGFSKATTQTVTAQCNSKPFTKRGQVYRAYPQGIKKRYNIIRKTYVKGKLTKTTTSAGVAFNPQGVSCSLS